MTLGTRMRPLSSRARAAHERLPFLAHPAFVVGGIVLAAFAVVTWYVLEVDGWFVMTDEMLYVKLADSIGQDVSLVPRVHGEGYDVYSQLYPLLLSPFVRFLPMPTAFEAAHVLNAALMASAAIPTYLLARSARLPRLAGYLAAALTVAVPWMVESAVIWTEAAGYMGLMWGAYGIHRALVAPGDRGDLIALGGIAIAALSRTQFLALIAVLPLAIVLHEAAFLEREAAGGRLAALRALARRRAGQHRVLLGAYAVMLAGVLALALGRGVESILGTYAITWYELVPEGTFRSAGQHLAVVGVAVGVAPLILAAGWAVVTVVRPRDKERHALAVLGLLIVAVLAVEVGSFVVRFSESFQDRYFFYVAPLLFLGMAACLVEGRRAWPGVLGAGLLFVPMVDLASYEPGGAPPFYGSPAGVFWAVLDGRSYELGQRLSIAELSPVTVIEIGSVVLAVVLALGLRRFSPTIRLLAVCVPVLIFGAVETRYVLERIRTDVIPDYAPQGARLDQLDWIDDAVPDDAVVATVPGTEADFATGVVWWHTEFWNKTVRRAYSLAGAGTHTPFPAHTLDYDVDTGEVRAGDSGAGYFVRPSDRLGVGFEGRVVTGVQRLALIEVERPYRIAWGAVGFAPDGGMPKEGGLLRIFGDGARGPVLREVKVTLTSAAETDPNQPPATQLRRRYTIRVSGDTARGALQPGEVGTATVVACVPAGRWAGAAVEVTGNGYYGAAPGTVGLPVGIRVTNVEVGEPRPAPSGCRG